MLEEKLIWRTSFIVVALGVISLAVSLSIFFYIRSREPIWDNRSRTSRITAINPSTTSLGSEFFTMFSHESGAITLNGMTTEDENSIYIRNGGNFVLEITATNEELAVVHSKIYVSRSGSSDQVTPLDSNSTNITPTSVQITSLTDPSQVIVAGIAGNRLELSSSSSNTFRCGVRVLVGWYQ
jgi:hypothetical protein